MAEIMSYTPTVGMTADQRKEAGYYAVIKAWVQEHMTIFQKWCTVAYNDAECEITLTPIAENISNRPLTIEVSGTTLYFRYLYGSGTTTTYISAELNNDPPIHLYDSDDFFIGLGGTKLYYGIFRGKKFDDGTDVQVLFTT